MVSKKVILTGSFGVGKTSLFNRFLYQRFDERYLTTIGVKVDKKVIEIDGRELSMLVWDIAGEVTQDKVPHSYFLGASGIVFVFDLTRPVTYQHLEKDIAYLKNKVPGVTMRVVGNKKDLKTPEEIEAIISALPVDCDLTSSAKTGENVEALFQDMGRSLLSTLKE